MILRKTFFAKTFCVTACQFSRMFPKRPPRLDRIWIKEPVFFITSVSHNRIPCLTSPQLYGIIIHQLEEALSRYGWAVGDYVIMPDHIHFMCRPATGNAVPLIKFIGELKKWSAMRCAQQSGKIHQVWQPGFFDRLLRTEREWEEKRLYMLDNPVRAGFVTDSKDWPYQGDLDMFRM